MSRWPWFPSVTSGTSAVPLGPPWAAGLWRAEAAWFQNDTGAF